MASDRAAVSRRAFLTGQSTRGSAPQPQGHCISSAVVVMLPGREEEVLAALREIEGAEIRARQESRLVLLLEGASSGDVGGKLARIAVMEGVVAANMVFEHTEVTGA